MAELQKNQKIGKIDVECFDLIQWFVLVLLCDAFVIIILSDEPRQNQGRGLVDGKLVKAPQQFYCWPSQGGSSVLAG